MLAVWGTGVWSAECCLMGGDTVERREKIGTIGNGGGDILLAHLHLEIRKQTLEGYPILFWPSVAGKNRDWVLANYEKPSSFIKNRRKLKTSFYWTD